MQSVLNTRVRRALGLALSGALALGASVTILAQGVQINGAGATFPYPIYSKWFSEYNKLNRTSRSTTSRSAPAAASASSPTRRSSSAPPTAR